MSFFIMILPFFQLSFVNRNRTYIPPEIRENACPAVVQSDRYSVFIYSELDASAHFFQPDRLSVCHKDPQFSEPEFPEKKDQLSFLF